MTFRPALRPGTRVLRRDAHHLQVGTSPGRVVADRPGLYPLLLALDGRHDAAGLARLVPEAAPDLGAVLAHLTGLGIVLDGGRWDTRHDDEARHLALGGHDARVLARRRRTTVALTADAGTTALLDVVARALGEAGVRVAQDDRADLLVVGSVGEPGREPFAEAVRQRLPHLLVRAEADTVHVGPFVDPGRTPCLACDDLGRTDLDPAWAVLLPQFGRPADRHPPGTGAVLRHAVAAAVAGSVLAAIEAGRSPHGGVVERWGPDPDDRRRRAVPFHHRCGCALLPVG